MQTIYVQIGPLNLLLNLSIGYADIVKYMASQCATVNMLAPANIISTNIVPTKTSCTEPCDVNFTITWQNTGDITGQFIPGIIVDSGAPVTLPSEPLAAGHSTSHIFIILNLMTGIHTIQASPGGATPQTITVKSVAHIISSTLTVDKNDCITPCTVNGNVRWTNTGGSPGILDLVILINNVPSSIDTAVTINPGEIKSYTFQLPNLPAGTYIVCASPDSGTSCQTITVRAPNIVSTTIIPSKTTCTEPCDLTVDVTWTNLGDADGIFIPSIKIDENPISPAQYSSENLVAGEDGRYTFTITGLTEGTHTICPDPDTGVDCATITVTKVVSAGLGTAGAIIVAGLAVGTIYSMIIAETV